MLLAGNGQEGLEQFDLHQPDLVVTDIRMPVMTGLEMAAALRARRRMEPIIAVTASDRADDTIRSIEVGIDRYVLKPVQAGPLQQALLHCAHILRERAELQKTQAEARQLQRELEAANARLRLELAERRLLEDQRERAEAQVRAMNGMLAQQVRERTAQAALLASANRELESFSYSVSHDLRAPLRSITGFSQMLREDFGESLGPEGLGCLDRVQKAARRMGAIIEDLLRLSQAGRGELDRTPLDLSAQAGRILETLALADPARRVRTSLEANLPAMGDQRLLALVLENLLGNAWKYTGRTADPRIEFGRVPQDGEPVYFVRDNGAGFDMAQAGELFGAFHRLHTSEDFEGTGIGLAIVRRIIHRHGGKIWAEAEPGKGATFFFTLGVTKTDGDATNGQAY